MHRLHLLRHAKSRRDGGVEDRERTLSRQGREAATRLADSLPLALGAVDLVLCSPARRTRETAALALAGFAARPPVAFDDALYLAGASALLRRVQQLDEAICAVLIIGHNPGLHELALQLADPAAPRRAALAAGKFPTLARASFAIAGEWARLDRGGHALTGYATAKSPGG